MAVERLARQQTMQIATAACRCLQEVKGHGGGRLSHVESGRLRFIGMAVLIAAVWAIGVTRAADPWVDLTVRPADLVGTLSCSGTSCHASQQPRATSGTVSQQEFVHWLGGSPRFHDARREYDPRARLIEPAGDPHALAGWRILQPRFQEVLRRASVQADGTHDEATYQKCARCHDPHSVEQLPTGTSSLTQTTTEHGIGCESCHGGARRWLAIHYQRDVSREELADLGMIDTKNLLVRARVCAACHVGSEDNDMNHDMIAAGHPPLRFELASYEALIQHKHWDDTPVRARQPDYEFQLWAAGRIAAAEASLALLESRTRGQGPVNQGPRARNTKPWPEFSEMSCFACHQSLRPPVAGQRQSAPGLELSTAPWQAWNVALVTPIVEPHRSQGNLPPPKGRFRQALGELGKEFDRTLIPDAAQVAQQASRARAALRASMRSSADGWLVAEDGKPLEMNTILRSIADDNEPSWEATCQRLAALAAARRSVLDRGGIVHASWDERLKNVSAALQRTAPAEAVRASLKQELSNLARDLNDPSQRPRSTANPETLP